MVPILFSKQLPSLGTDLPIPALPPPGHPLHFRPIVRGAALAQANDHQESKSIHIYSNPIIDRKVRKLEHMEETSSIPCWKHLQYLSGVALYIYISIYLSIYLSIHRSIYIYIYTYACVLHIYIYINTCNPKHTYIYIHIDIYIYI